MSGATEALRDLSAHRPVDPALELIERLATALDRGARIDPGDTPEFRFETHAA